MAGLAMPENKKIQLSGGHPLEKQAHFSYCGMTRSIQFIQSPCKTIHAE